MDKINESRNTRASFYKSCAKHEFVHILAFVHASFYT